MEGDGAPFLAHIGREIEEFRQRYPLFWSIVCEGKDPQAPPEEPQTAALLEDFADLSVDTDDLPFGLPFCY